MKEKYKTIKLVSLVGGTVQEFNDKFPEFYDFTKKLSVICEGLEFNIRQDLKQYYKLDFIIYNGKTIKINNSAFKKLLTGDVSDFLITQILDDFFDNHGAIIETFYLDYKRIQLLKDLSKPPFRKYRDKSLLFGSSSITKEFHDKVINILDLPQETPVFFDNDSVNTDFKILYKGKFYRFNASMQLLEETCSVLRVRTNRFYHDQNKLSYNDEDIISLQ